MRMHYTQVKMGLLSQIPLGDFGDPIDIAEVAGFLASSRYIYKNIFGTVGNMMSCY